MLVLRLNSYFLRSVLVYFGSRRERESWRWAWLISTRLARQIGYLELLLKLMFVNPLELPEQTTRALPVRWGKSFKLEQRIFTLVLAIVLFQFWGQTNLFPLSHVAHRFLFTDYNRLSSVGGETSLAEMIATLSDACEREFGFLATRLFRVFMNDEIKGKAAKMTLYSVFYFSSEK